MTLRVVLKILFQIASPLSSCLLCTVWSARKYYVGLLIVRGGALLSFFLVFTIPSPSLTLLLFESTFFHMPVLYVPWGLGGGGGEIPISKLFW